MADRPVLIVGSTGFVGGNAADAFVTAGHPVIGTSTTGEGADLACDLRDAESTRRALTKAGPGTVVMAAGLSSVGESWNLPGETFRVNTRGVFNLLEAARGLPVPPHFIFASSATVYGAPASPEDVPFLESSPAAPASPYGASKAAAEVLCGQFARELGLEIAVTRIFNQIGPGQDDSQAPAEFAREIARAEAAGRSRLELGVGDPTVERDFVDVRDTARAFLSLAEDRITGTFNVCSGTGTSLGRIVELLAAASTIAIEIVKNPEHHRPADIPLVYGSAKRLGRAIGWRPSIPLERSLSDLLEDWRRRI